MTTEPQAEDRQMSDEIKYMDIAEFRELGYLHEINRLLLHPLGLAMEVSVAEDGTESLGRVWDYRADPEGMEFGEDLLSPEKALRIAGEMFERRSERIKALGWVIQPIEGQKVLTTNYTDPDAYSVMPEMPE